MVVWWTGFLLVFWDLVCRVLGVGAYLDFSFWCWDVLGGGLV